MVLGFWDAVFPGEDVVLGAVYLQMPFGSNQIAPREALDLNVRPEKLLVVVVELVTAIVEAFVLLF